MDLHDVFVAFDDPLRLPRTEMRWCLDHRSDVLPTFIDVLRRYNAGDWCEPEEEEALFFIIHLLGEIGDPAAFAPIMDFVRGDATIVEYVLGDAVTEYLNGILISTYDGDKERLYDCILDPSTDEYVRSATLNAWAYLVAAGRIGDDEAKEFLNGAIDRFEPQSDCVLWTTWLFVVSHLGFEDLKTQAKVSYERGFVALRGMTYDEFLNDIETAKASPDRVTPFHDNRIHPFTDAVGMLSRWYSFSSPGVRERLKEQRSLRAPQTEQDPYRHVGRNDLCPCGSGKKFKRCCLH